MSFTVDDVKSLLPDPSNQIWIWNKQGKKNSVFQLRDIMLQKYDLEFKLIQLRSGVVNGIQKSEGYEKYLQYPNSIIKALATSIVDSSDTNDEKMYKIEQWVIDNIEYKSDESNYGKTEYWAYPTLTFNKKSGDCIANYEELWTKEGLKKVGDLKIGDVVLSYDFNKKKYCYKPIIKIWEKGELPIFRVHFRNGTWIDVTEDHPFWIRQTQQNSEYKKCYLKDIDLSRWWKRKIPCVKKLPYEVKDIEWLTEDLCFVIGYFLAEGWVLKDRYEVCIGGYDIPDHIVPILDINDIPYGMSLRSKDGLPRIRFKNSKLKTYLNRLKTNSFNINIPEEIFYLPENKLQKLIDGHFLGDGHKADYSDKRGSWQNNRKKIYSTSSNQLAFDIQRIHLQLGKPIHMWLQKHHGGLGNKPIWRLNYNTNSRFVRSFGYDNISEVSIKNYEYLHDTKVRDFTVKDTYTFVSKFGHLIHNCEDGSFLIHSIGLNAGVPYDRLRTYGGLVVCGEGAAGGGHGWTTYKREDDNEWVTLDWCYYPTNKDLYERTPMKDDEKYIDDYWYLNAVSTVETPFTNKVRFVDVWKGGLINIKV